jgi:hypothetical protein
MTAYDIEIELRVGDELFKHTTCLVTNCFDNITEEAEFFISENSPNREYDTLEVTAVKRSRKVFLGKYAR